VEIYTSYVPEQARACRRLGRRSAEGQWIFLISGEWSQSPYHQGDIKFFVRSSRAEKHWALLVSGFPRRIVATAFTPEPAQLEVVAAAMMRAVKQADGEYIDLVEDYGDDVDGAVLWRLYRGRPAAMQPE
jgi:hypothetical protein